MTEFDDVIRLLREGRPQATELELDQIKQRVRRQAAKPSRRSQSMKSRLAIVGMLVAGMVFSTAGAGLAVSGLSDNNASVAQYATPTTTPTGGVLPGSANSPGAGKKSTKPTTAVKPATAVQPARQVEAGATNNTLPFTGFAAIPVMLGGIALLTGGLFLRRRSRTE
jgi:uncharacterized membrane protein